MSVAASIDGVLKGGRNPTPWTSIYVIIVSIAGCYTTFLAITLYDHAWRVLCLFAVLGVVAESAHVKLFAKSHSAISMGFVVAIAASVTLGPWAGVVTHLASGMATFVPGFLWRKRRKTSLKSFLRKSLFNMSMWVLSSASAGLLYVALGGTPGVTTWRSLLPLSLAVLADMVVNMGLLIALISLETQRHPLQIWVEDWRWAMPITLSGGIIGGGALATAYTVAGPLGLMLFLLPVLAIGYAFRLYLNHLRSYVDQLEIANQQIEQANLNLLHTLGAVIDAYDLYTFGHSAQVARYAGAIAEVMGLPLDEQMAIVRGALIHDIGKVGVTDAIIGKQGRLTDEEFEMMKLHTVIGAEIVSQMPLLQHLVPLVRNHHERWDGQGYPDGLQGDEIALAARIVAVADSVEAMLSDRPYQGTRALQDVVAEVSRCAGKQYDPAVVQAFVAVAEARGNDFFINSAAQIAQELKMVERLDATERIWYVKKSMAHITLLMSAKP